LTRVTLDIHPTTGAVTAAITGVPTGADTEAHYCSPTGAADAAGTLADPWPLSKLATSGAVAPGGTVLLLGGTYVGAFTFAQKGTAAKRITIQNAPGATVVLDRARKIRDDGLDGLRIEGDYQDIRENTTGSFRITNSNTERVLTGPESSGGGRPVGFRIAAGKSNRLINVWVHDTGGNVLDAGAVDCVTYGCTITREGWDGDRGYGHGLYPQNFAGAGRKTFTNCIVGNGYAHCYHNFGGSSKMSEITIDGCTLFQASACTQTEKQTEPILIAGETGGATGEARIDGVAIRRTVAYQRYGDGFTIGAIRLGTIQPSGHTPQVHGNIEVTDCHFVGVVIVMEEVQALRYQRNLCFGQARPGGVNPFPIWEYWRGGTPQQQVDHYVNFVVQHAAGGALTGVNGNPITPDWIRSGYAAPIMGGTNTYASQIEFPPDNYVRVDPNEYEEGRANVTIVNWQNLAAVPVDMDGVCVAGADYVLIDVESEVSTPFTYAGTPLAITMDRSPALDPIGGSIQPIKRTGTKFGAFVIRKA
jgi:hypothetical protein